jgi:alkylation response protein AidB-like acyl-CoA dehydrogenase
VSSNELHDELRTVTRQVLGQADPDLAQLAALGWLGLEVPEALDGAGATFAEVALVLEEMGRATTSGPFFATAVLGVGTLMLLEPTPERDDLLRLVASGDCRLAVAWAGPGFRVRDDGDGPRLDGRADLVADAAGADRLLLVAHGPDRASVVQVSPGDEGVRVEARPVLDATRSFARVTADGAAVDSGSVWRFSGHPEAALGRLRDRAAVALACDSLGLSEAMLEATVAYAGVRKQFERAIGSFQAVKHACADMLVQVSLGRELARAAVDALVADDRDASVAASMAKAHVCGAAVDIVGKAMQLHGGVGYTWESGVHVFLKRATLNRAWFGSPAEHRRRIATRYASMAQVGDRTVSFL